MCGLVGIAGKLGLPDESFMKRLLIFDYLRGTDSTGMAFLRGSATASPRAGLTKIASHPFDLFDMKSFNAALNGYTSSVFLGHNRAATVGKVSGLNAHPFNVGDIYGAHNGTLHESCWKALDKLTGVETDVDSLSLYTAIEMFGPEEVIPLVEEGSTHLKGAWALTWFDAKKDKLYFLKNKHRPLWIAYSEDLTKIIWASEYWMIDAATKGGKEEFKLWRDKEGYAFFPLEDNKLYEIDLEELKQTGKKKPPKWITKEIKGKEPTPYVSTGAAPFQMGHNKTHGKTTSSHSTGSTHTTNRTTQSTVTELFGDSSEPYAGFIDRTDFDAIAKYGCSWCSADIEYGELGVAIYERSDTILCPSCSGVKEDQIRVYADPQSFESLDQRILRCQGM